VAASPTLDGPHSRDIDTSSLRDGRQHWDAIADAWASTGRDKLWREHSDIVNRALVEEWVPPGGVGTLMKTDAFDEAASQGLDDLLAAHATNVVYIDLSFRMLRSASRAHGSISAVCCDVRQLPFASGSIAAIVSNSTLDHFPSVQPIITSLGELSRVLCSEGRLLLTMDNPVNPLIRLRQWLPQRLLRRVGLVPYFVGATLGPAQLRRCLVEAGFQVRHIGAILHCPRVFAVFCSRVLQRWASPRTRSRFLAVLLGFERLKRWPTKYLSGYYVSVSAVRSPHVCRSNPSRASDTARSS